MVSTQMNMTLRNYIFRLTTHKLGIRNKFLNLIVIIIIMFIVNYSNESRTNKFS